MQKECKQNGIEINWNQKPMNWLINGHPLVTIVNKEMTLFLKGKNKYGNIKM